MPRSSLKRAEIPPAHGCWTCRIRRKRCDVQAGRCATCARLGLSCDGYGPKPHWMDGGDRERLRRAELKLSIKINGQRRASLSEGPEDLSCPDNDSSVQTAHTSSRGSSSSQFSHVRASPVPQSAQPHSYSIPATESHFHTASPGVQPSSEPDLYIDPAIFNSDFTHARDASLDKDIFDTNTSADHGFNFFDFASDQPGPVEEDLQWVGAPELSHEPFAGGKAGPSWHPELFMVYIDQVFDLHFPFHRYMLEQHSRGWVFSFLQESITFRCLVLALASFHLESQVQHGLAATHNSPAVVPGSWRTYHIEALQYMQQNIHQLAQLQSSEPRLRIKMRITLLACNSQLAELACMADQPENACCHLDASIQIIRFLVQDLERLQTSLTLDPESGENSYVYAALPHILCSLLRRDTLIAAAFRQAPRSDSDLTAWLIRKTKSASAGMTDMMSLLRETAALDAWKSLCVQRGCLSHFTLVEKASRIQRSLQSLCEDTVSSVIPRDLESVRLDKSLDQRSFGHASRLMIRAPPSPKQNWLDTTQPSTLPPAVFIAEESNREYSALRISFGYATLIYLHVAVSGPTAPEIEDCLAKALEALQFLALCNGLAAVIWPLCVVGSLAQGSQRDFFTSLKDSIDANSQKTRYTTRHLHNALRIVFKCWETSDGTEDGSNHSWATVSHELDIRCTF